MDPLIQHSELAKSVPLRQHSVVSSRGLILIVDDQPTNLKVLRGALASTPYQLTFATSGQQALKRIQATPPDLILLDVMMPVMDGFEVCRQLKQSPDYSNIPIIFLTANHELDTLTKAFELGAVDYLTKPFKTLELLARIKTHLNLRQLQQKVQQQLVQEQLVRQIIASIHRCLGVEAVLRETAKQIQSLLVVSRVLIGQYTSPKTMKIVAISDDLPLAQTDFNWPNVETETYISSNDELELAADDTEWLQQWQVQSEMRYPLWCRQELWGCLIVQYLDPNVDNTAWSALFRPIIEQLQIALEQAELLIQLEKANGHLLYLANTDPLTQLANRRYLDLYIEREWLRLQRNQQPLSILLMDIDYFKVYNDTYGHVQGDECLRLVAKTLTTITKRPADLAIRYGGEEFLLVLPNTDASGATAVAQQIQQAMMELNLPHDGHASSDCVTLSLGVATQIPAADGSWLQFLEQADQALYKAKNSGRNQYILVV